MKCLYIFRQQAAIVPIAGMVVLLSAYATGQTTQLDHHMSQTAHSEAHAAEHEHTNRLVNETSPYLLQHAHNPVDWYPWGDEAFTVAREQNKLIFLSVGYSTCYWCHVMERESFESEDVAAVMNEHCINIKVDREERPDVDDIYMTATQIYMQLTTGRAHGGWPMSVWIEPQSLKPIMCGTYFPREQFVAITRRIADVWTSNPDDLKQQADQIATIVQQQAAAQMGGEASSLDAAVVESAVAGLMQAYDPTHAGFGHAPKFPQPVYLELLMGAAWGDETVRRAILHTLDRMATGGMYDQIGGGFHRYSTDEQWLVPHFEKMLYDNGQLASVYALAYEMTGDALYEEITRETLDYVVREMTDASGAFLSAQDAEVDAREGLNYLWLPDQVREALAHAGLGDDFDFALQVYGLDKGTNFQDPHHPEDGPKNVIYLVDRPEALAQKMGKTHDAFNGRLVRINEALLKVRDKRKQPGTDDKVLVAWNGLMITGFSDAGRILQEQKYIDAAVGAANFVLREMATDEGGLLRTYRGGTSRIDAFFEDYALLIEGLLALHEATNGAMWLDAAVRLSQEAHERFWDDAAGAYFDTLADQPDLFVRTKTVHDGAVPSGNGTMVNNLITLHERTHDHTYLNRAADMLRAMSASISQSPVGSSLSTLALHRLSTAHPAALQIEHILTSPITGGSGASPVTVSIDPTSLSFSDARTQVVQVTLDIDQGYHINAHEPGIDEVVPLSIEVEDHGGLIFSVRYPQGEVYEGPIADQPLQIHRNKVSATVAIWRVGDITGSPILRVTYQVCTDTACLKPTTESIALTDPSKTSD